MTDLETLYRGTPEDGPLPGYDAARERKVQQVADYIRDYLRDPHLAEALAEDVMTCAEEIGRFEGDCIHGEISSRYTISRNPLSFTV